MYLSQSPGGQQPLNWNT